MPDESAANPASEAPSLLGKWRYYEFLLPSTKRFQVRLFFSARRTDIVDTIEFNGSQDFLSCTKEALKLL